MMPAWRQAVLVMVGAGILGVPASPVAAQRPFPYRLTAWVDGPLAVAGAGLLAGGVVVGNGQVPLTPAEIGALDPAQVNGFDRGATRQWSPGAGTASDVLVYTLLASPVALMVTPPGSHAVLTVAVMYGEALLLGNGATSLLKSATERTRPYVYNDDPGIPADEKQSLHARRSFPSGHTMHAMTAAVFLSTVYGKLHPTSSLRPWLWAGSLTAAGTVGYLRYRSGDHFPTDVIAGAALGGLVGWAVPRLHERDDVNVTIAPTGGGATLVVSLRH
jgi:hypothetical protein